MPETQKLGRQKKLNALSSIERTKRYIDKKHASLPVKNTVKIIDGCSISI
ncbi:hypothetical protein [Solimicrobium silvestre]|nr:hypothetical protein [Solimicrobium silvestre]